MTEQELKDTFPSIAWDDPVEITVPGLGRGLGCRFCIAQYGLSGSDVQNLPQTQEEFEQHMVLMH
jgi:hypothetical protein